MEHRGWARVGPVAGILAVVTFVASHVVFGMRADTSVRPGDPAEEIARAMTASMDSGAGLTVVMPLLLSIFLLIWFLGDLHQRLQQGVDPAGRWIATVFLAGGLVLVAALLFQGFVWLVQSTLTDFGDDVQVAKTLFVLGWVGSAVVIPGIAAMTGAATVLSLRFGVLPRWLGVVSALAFVAGFVSYWIPVWTVWVLLTSITLLVRPQQPSRKQPVPV